MRSARPVLLVWLLLATLSLSLALRATLVPPRGTVFVGTFYFVDDFYNYLSHVEQAQRGAVLLKSKLAPPELRASLLNLEWLAAGWLAAGLGGRTLLAYRALGLLALGLLLWQTDRLLARAGLAEAKRGAGLALVFTGGGLGGLLVALGRLPGERAFDVRAGAFPIVETLAHPHFVAGTALLVTALVAFSARRPWRGAAIGTVLGLVRPYDAALLAGVEAATVVLTTPIREWPRRLAPVAALVPVLAYTAWLFLLAPGFRAFANPRYAALAPSIVELLLALGPAALLALTSAPAWRDPGAASRPALLRLALWAGLAVLVVTLRPVSFSLQFLVGAGLPLLGLAAIGLARRPYRLELSLPLMAGTAVLVTWYCTLDVPGRYAAAEHWQIASALRGICRPGERLLSPADLGLYAGGLTPCWPFLSHPAAPDYERHAELTARFYAAGTAPAERGRLLESLCPAHVVLPPTLPAGWLGGATAYTPRFVAAGPRGALAVWSRDAAAACLPP